MSEYHASEYYSDKEALIESLEENRTNAVKFLWRSGANNPSLRGEVANRISLLELAIDELKSGNKEPAEVVSYFKKLVQEDLKALKNSIKFVEVLNKKGLPKQPSKVIKPKIRVV